MRKLLFYITIVYICSFAAGAQKLSSDFSPDTTIIDNSSHQLGLTASTSQGVGFGYKRWYKKRLGLQGSILPLFMDETHLTLSGSLLCRFALKHPSFPYVNLGALYYRQRHGSSHVTNQFGIGVGAGYEFNIQDVLAINLKIDAMLIFESGYYPTFIPFPLPGLAIMYRF